MKIHNGTILEVLEGQKMSLNIEVNRDMREDDILSISQFAKEAMSYFNLKGDINLTIGNSVEEIDGYHRYVNGEHYIYYAKISHLPTLTHEFIHAFQHERGDLFILKNNVIYWKGEKNSDRYLDQPWEIEAFNSQGELTNTILKRCYK